MGNKDVIKKNAKAEEYSFIKNLEKGVHLFNTNIPDFDNSQAYIQVNEGYVEESYEWFNKEIETIKLVIENDNLTEPIEINLYEWVKTDDRPYVQTREPQFKENAVQFLEKANNIGKINLTDIPDEIRENIKNEILNEKKNEQALQYLAKNFNLLFLDTETSGLDPKTNHVIDLGVMKLNYLGDNQYESVPVINELIKLDNGEKIPDNIVELTHITNEDLEKNGKSREEIKQKLSNLIMNADKPTVVVAYNAHFDNTFVQELLSFTEDRFVSLHWLDAMTLYKESNEYPHKLIDAIEKYNLQEEANNSHRAYDDAFATYKVFERLVDERTYSDIENYIDVFGFNPKYGLESRGSYYEHGERKTILYLPQGFEQQELVRNLWDLKAEYLVNFDIREKCMARDDNHSAQYLEANKNCSIISHTIRKYWNITDDDTMMQLLGNRNPSADSKILPLTKEAIADRYRGVEAVVRYTKEKELTLINDVHAVYQGETGLIETYAEFNDGTEIKTSQFKPEKEPSTKENIWYSKYGDNQEYYNIALEEAHKSGYYLEGEDLESIKRIRDLEEARKTTERPKNNKEFQDKILADFIASLDQPPEKWKEGFANVVARPQNAFSGRPYTGLNGFYLMLWMAKHGQRDPRFTTYDKVQKEGLKIKKGESAKVSLRVGFMEVWDSETNEFIVEPVVKRSLYENDPRYEISKDFLGYRFYPLFHASQIEGLKPFKALDFKNENIKVNEYVNEALYALNLPLIEDKIKPTKKDRENTTIFLEDILGMSCPYYSPSKDEIHVPPMDKYFSDTDLAVDILHEMIHATGHPDRLNRDSLKNYGKSSETRAKEELVAEIGAILCRSAAGIETTSQSQLANHKAYCQSWKKSLSEKDGFRQLEEAVNNATKASTYLIEKTNKRIRDINELEGFMIYDQDRSKEDGKMMYVAKSSSGPMLDFTDDILKAKVYQTEFELRKEHPNLKVTMKDGSEKQLDICMKEAHGKEKERKVRLEKNR